MCPFPQSVVTERNSTMYAPWGFRCRREGCPHWHTETDYMISTHRYCCNACRHFEGGHTRRCTGYGEAVGLHSTSIHRARSVRRHGDQQTDPFPRTSADRSRNLIPAHSNASDGQSLRGNPPWIHLDQDPETQFATSVRPPMGLNMKSLCLYDANGRLLRSTATCTPLQYIETLTAMFNMQLSARARLEWKRTSQIIVSNYCNPPEFEVLIRILSYDHADSRKVPLLEPLDCTILNAKSDRFRPSDASGVYRILQAHLATDEQTPLLIREAVFRLETDQDYNAETRVVDFACSHGTHRSVACAVLLAVLAYPRAKILPCSHRVQNDLRDEATLTWGL